jgi:phosphopantetheinyl transferase
MLDALELTPLALGEDGVEVRVLDLARLEDPESIAVRVLAAAERVEYVELHHPLRRREWLGARVCLKLMVSRRGLVDDPRDCAVIKDPRGRPRLVFAGALTADVAADCSLSHKGRFVCAAVSTTVGSRIGVDIEEVSPRLRRLARQFAHERDTVLGSRPEEERLAILWALKEACSKVVGRGLAMALREVSCQEIAPGRYRVMTTGLELAGRHTMHDGYAVALCWGTDQTLGR